MRVGVLASGSGTILQAMLDRKLPIVVVLADRPCGALGIAENAGIGAELVERTDFSSGFDRVAYTKEVVAALERTTSISSRSPVRHDPSEPFVDSYGARAVNTHPALLPAFKGWHAVRDALAAGVKVTGCTVHLVTEDVDSGPILAQEAVPVLDDDTEETLHERIKRSSARLYPDVIEQTGPRGLEVSRRERRSNARCFRCGTRPVSSIWRGALHELGVELVSSGGTATAIADAGIRSRRARRTGVPEMLDHRSSRAPQDPRRPPRDRGKATHRADLETHGIQPFDLVVSNLYPFLERPEIDTIDIGGPAMTRAAAKNHEWVTIVTSPDQYGRSSRSCAPTTARSAETRRELAREAFARTAAYDAAIVQWFERDELLPRTSCSRSTAPTRRCATARTRTSRARATGGTDDELVGRRDPARRARALVPQLLRRRCRVAARARPRRSARVRHHQAREPVRRRVDDDLATAYARALACDERSAFGGIVALNRPIDAATVELMVRARRPTS
jgi:formyltetrahydrofolate-dependent phosphoribosylglycinamide formyltransferase